VIPGNNNPASSLRYNSKGYSGSDRVLNFFVDPNPIIPAKEAEGKYEKNKNKKPPNSKN
jgi:hypothetical protein